MSQIDFYILSEESALKALHFACKLIEKEYAEQKQIYIHTDSQNEAERIDALLWTFNDISFIPHALVSKETKASVQIGFDSVTDKNFNVLVNLSKHIPTFYTQFKRVIEIVFADPTMQQLARERFRSYREEGCEIKTYKPKANEV